MTLKDQELYANKIKLYNQKFETIREKPYFVCSPYFDMNNERSRQTLMQFSTKREQTSHRHQHFNSPTENLNKIHSCKKQNTTKDKNQLHVLGENIS